MEDGLAPAALSGTGEGPWRCPGRSFFAAGAPELARSLLGCLLEVEGDPRRSGVIVETEAYTEEDPASHSARGMTARNRSMFDAGGSAYVYFVYGMHCCFNVTAGPAGSGEAVLIRALEPGEGIGPPGQETGGGLSLAASGPGRLCRAMGIGLEQNGADLLAGPVRILLPRKSPRRPVGISPRIGISRGGERMWRFFFEDSPCVSDGRGGAVSRARRRS